MSMNEKSVTRPRPAKCPELEVVNAIIREGLACSHEHPGYVSITDARERHWAFGTINGTWDGHQVGNNGEATAPFVDLGFDGDCEDWKAIADTIIKVCSMDIPDGLAECITLTRAINRIGRSLPKASEGKPATLWPFGKEAA